VLYQFSEPADRDVVYTFERLRSVALTPTKSVQLLGALLDSL
jgi:hypothetical protein